MKAVRFNQLMRAMVVAAGLAATGARAEEAAAEAPAATASATLDVASAYVFRGGTVNDEVNVQPGLEGKFFSDALLLGTWGNLNTDSSNFDEVDYYGSYTLPLPEEVPVGVSVGYTEYTYPSAEHEHPTGLEPGSVSPAVEADREINLAFTHSAELNEDTTWDNALMGNFGLEGPFLEDGINVTLDSLVSYAATEAIGLNGGATIGSEMGDNYANSGVSYVQLNLGATYAAFNAGIHYVIETDDDVLVVDEDFWGSVGIALPL